MFIRITEEIEAPPEMVWNTISDIQTHVNWMADASEIRITSEQTEGVGVTFDCDTKVGPLRTTDKMQITEWTPNQTLTISHKGLVEGKGSFVLERNSDGKTLFVWEESLDFPLLLGGRITGFFAKPVLKKIWKKNLYKLKHLVETS
ncbi:MAG: SRPBCC family protein [Acidimicrobiales bacterium]|jgi:carbon monoxide dehydrogenase subunit G|nr:SRPBCC family protein [Acidimicrobiales bacterium]